MDTKSIELPIFGNITLKKPIVEWKYKYTYKLCKHELNGNPIDLDVNFIEVTEENVDKVSKALNYLEELNAIGTDGFMRDFEEDGETKSYIDEWYGDIFEQIFTEEEFENFIMDTDSEKSIEERLLLKLRLVRVGIYADSDFEFVVMDYAFGYDTERGFRDNMLIVKLNQEYKICEIVNEG